MKIKCPECKGKGNTDYFDLLGFPYLCEFCKDGRFNIFIYLKSKIENMIERLKED